MAQMPSFSAPWEIDEARATVVSGAWNGAVDDGRAILWGVP